MATHPSLTSPMLPPRTLYPMRSGDVTSLRTDARRIAKKHDADIHVRAHGRYVSVHVNPRTESVALRVELLEMFQARGLESYTLELWPGTGLAGQIELSRKWDHAGVSESLMRTSQDD